MLFNFLTEQYSAHLLHNRLLLSPDAKIPNTTAAKPGDVETSNMDLHTVSTVDNLNSNTPSSGILDSSYKVCNTTLISNSTSTTASSTTFKKRSKVTNAKNSQTPKLKQLTSAKRKSRCRNDTIDDNKEKPKSKKQKTEKIANIKKKEPCVNVKHHGDETTTGCTKETDAQQLNLNYYLCQ